MANESQFLQEGRLIDHTPSGAVAAGSIIQVGSLCAFAPNAIAAGVVGAVAVSGVLRTPYAGGIANVGDNIWWDANGAPYGGAGDGACIRNAAAGDWWVGTLVRATVAASTTCDVALNQENPNLPAWQGKTHFLVATDTSFAAATHSGGVIHVTDDGGHDTKITMPAAVAGMDVIIQLDDADGVMTLQVDFNGTETVAGANLAIASGELAKNTIGTSKRGDYIHLRANCNAATGCWVCLAKRGTWVSAA